jgi:hypothetical protein
MGLVVGFGLCTSVLPKSMLDRAKELGSLVYVVDDLMPLWIMDTMGLGVVAGFLMPD